jgi:hypothetical protein
MSGVLNICKKSLTTAPIDVQYMNILDMLINANRFKHEASSPKGKWIAQHRKEQFMKTLRVIFVLLAVALVIASFSFAQGPPGLQRVPEFAKSQAIMNLRGAAAPGQIGKPVDVDGFYYDGSIPMILDDFQRALVDMVMPTDSYVPLVGTLPKGVKNGDRISIKRGKLDRPSSSDHASVRGEQTVLRLGTDATIAVLQPSTLQVATLPAYHIYPSVRLLPRYLAVLIAGGYDPANNHVRYWNDLKTMYAILRNAGYPAANIVVIYADGVARDASMPVNYSATAANIGAVFTLLASKMASTDTLYIMLSDHGSPNALCLWNQTTISATAFCAEVNKIKGYSNMIIQMKQCYSGSFIPCLTGTRRTVMSSCSATQVSWSTSSGLFGEFTFWYFAALTGSKPDGSGAVNADTNRDGKISILEAYNFARSNDHASETPYFEDDGVAPAHSGPMPAGGDGTRSTTIFLH